MEFFGRSFDVGIDGVIRVLTKSMQDLEGSDKIGVSAGAF